MFSAPQEADDDRDVPPTIAACLLSDAHALFELDRRSACEARSDGLPPALFFAVELGSADVIHALLSGADGLNVAQREQVCAAASDAVTPHDDSADDNVPGARYHALLWPSYARG